MRERLALCHYHSNIREASVDCLASYRIEEMHVLKRDSERHPLAHARQDLPRLDSGGGVLASVRDRLPAEGASDCGGRHRELEMQVGVRSGHLHHHNFNGEGVVTVDREREELRADS
jgi:hypothetical protein